MKVNDGLKLTPIFYSEISSSYLVYEILRNHTDLAKSFLKAFFGLDVGDNHLTVLREKSYRGKGSIDLYLSFVGDGIKHVVLIEVKVHDYLSATPGQIKTYYDAAAEENIDGKVFFMYLTQFNKKNFPKEEATILAPTIKEYEDSLKALGTQKDKIKHINWEEFYNFISQHDNDLSGEEALMLGLQKKWMVEKSEQDIAANTIDVGERTLFEYFDDVEMVLQEELPFGRVVNKNKRENFIIDLTTCSAEQLNRILDVIKTYSASARIDRKTVKNTEDYTIKAAKEWLTGLAEDETGWDLLSFYSTLFSFVNSTSCILLNGTGSRGFSVKVNIVGKGSISLCTLWSNKTIEFSLKR